MKAIDLLKSEIEEAAFMLVDDANRKEIHAKLVGCLVILGQLRDSDVPAEGHLATSDQTSTSQMEEVSKVRRRLEMWAKPGRQSQYNSRILNAFLELRRGGQSRISESDIVYKLGANDWFSANFVQMKAIAERNHGKVFEVTGQFVDVWEPVKEFVKEYERTVFGEAVHND